MIIKYISSCAAVFLLATLAVPSIAKAANEEVIKTPPPLLSPNAIVDNNQTLLQATAMEDTNTTVEILNKVTLKDAVKEAIDANYRVKQAKERVVQANYMVREALGEFLPAVTLSNTNMRKQMNGFDKQNYAQYDYSASLNYNLFASGRDAATLDKNKLVKNEQEEKLKGTMQEEINKMIDAYCSVVFGRLSVEANTRNYEKLSKIYEIVKIKSSLGAATKGDESSIAASLANAKTAKMNTESAYNNAKDYYEFLINQKADDRNPYETNFDIALEEFDPIYENIKTNNTDLNIMRRQIDEKKKDVYIAKSTSWPTVDFTASTTRRYRNDLNNDGSSITITDGENSDTLLQIVVSYDIYTGGKTEAKTARTMSEVSDKIYNLEYTIKETKWDSQKLFNSVQTNTNTLKSLEKEIDESRKMAYSYWERFRLSSQDLVILLQAQRQVNTAELEQLRSQKTRIIDYFNLLTKQGKLLEYFGY